MMRRDSLTMMDTVIHRDSSASEIFALKGRSIKRTSFCLLYLFFPCFLRKLRESGWGAEHRLAHRFEELTANLVAFQRWLLIILSSGLSTYQCCCTSTYCN